MTSAGRIVQAHDAILLTPSAFSAIMGAVAVPIKNLSVRDMGEFNE
jgi:hypothetical protein